MQTLLIHLETGFGSPAGHQIDGFSMYRRGLRGRLGMEVEAVETLDLGTVEAALRASRADLALIMVHYSVPADQLEAMFARLRRDGVTPKLVFLDYYAPSSSPHFGVLPHVDRYIKRQVLRDRSIYQKDLVGGSLFTDYLASTGRYDLRGWHFGAKPDPELMGKVVDGWNLGVTPFYRKLLRLSRTVRIPWKWRRLAINRRFTPPSTGPREWYQVYRDNVQEILEPIARDYPCTGTGRIGRRGYLRELAFSKMVVSPFGWGEICFRDYEAVSLGALLIKPSMAHLVTSPDIFVDGETYVAVRWDLSDLAEKCRYYLDHPAEARAIASRAQAVLSRYFEHGGFVDDIERTLDGLVEPASGRVNPALV